MTSDERQVAEEVRTWEIVRASVQPGTRADKERLNAWLREGWEPFAVTWDGTIFDYHLRRRTDG
jgi:hypothetical protein